jgi:hypothetical protein
LVLGEPAGEAAGAEDLEAGVARHRRERFQRLTFLSRSKAMRRVVTPSLKTWWAFDDALVDEGALPASSTSTEPLVPVIVRSWLRCA